MNSLKKYRRRDPGLPDLLNYAAVIDDGVILNKDGSLMAGWYYRGADNASATDEERNNLSTRINSALSRLGSGWMSHHDAIRLPADDYPAEEASHFPDPITRLIETERRHQFLAEGSHYVSHYALILTYTPPLRAKSKVADMMFDDHRPTAKQDSAGTRAVEYFKQQLAAFEDSLSGNLKVSRMVGRKYLDESGRPHVNDELLQYLHYCITGDLHPVNLPPVPMYLDTIIGGREFVPGITPKIGEKYILPIAIDGFPQESYPGILATLDQFPTEYRWSTRFIYLDSHEAKAELLKYQRKWLQKVRGFFDQVFKTSNGNIDQDALKMAADVDDALEEASSGLVTYGYYTTVIILMHQSRETLELTARDIRKQIQNLGFGCRFESINAVEAWLGTLPGHALPNLRRPLMHTMQLADFLPLAAIWPGEAFCPCPFYPPHSPPLFYAGTDGTTPFRMNFHVGDLGHTLILGPTGSGKSTLLALVAASFRRYAGACIYAFDKGSSLYPLVKASGGSHHNIAGESSSLSFAPLSGIHELAERVWAEEWIATLIELQGMVLLPSHRNEIHRAMNLLAEAPANERSLTHFSATVQDMALRDAIAPYTISGSLGGLLDSATDTLTMGSFQVFEIEDLMQLGDRNVIPVLTYLFHRIERSLKGQPAMIELDEAWLMLGHKVFKSKIREWLKVLRKANCIVVLATQSLSDAARSGIMDVLMESCPTKIFLPNESATQAGVGDVQGPRDLYAMLGLNERQIEIIQGATPKRHYYYCSSEGRRLLDLNLGPVALSFVGASGKRDLSKIRELIASHGDQWPWLWLQHRNVQAAEPSAA